MQALSRHDPRSGDPSSVQAFIPIPDNTGLVDNYAELYPPKKWKDPLTYLCTSATVEEHITDAIAEGFTYYMDERDAEWLNRNNEAARGEGTSAQGAISANARTSVRNAKGKGKEDASVQITENEFELVMGAFEWVTQHNTEFLHLVRPHVRCVAAMIERVYRVCKTGCPFLASPSIRLSSHRRYLATCSHRT